MKKLIGALKKRQRFWDLAHFAGRFMPLAYFKRLPRVIKFEATNICNLRCPVCPTHFAIKRPKGFLDFDLYKKVIDEFKTFRKKPKIDFSMSGEPLLHKKIPEFIEYANNNGHTTYISTNATKLDRTLSERLIYSGLSTITLAIDGYSKKSHETYRIGSDFMTVKRNIERFLKIKQELKSKTPKVEIQTLLTSYSEKEIDKLIDWGREIGADRITFKSFSMGSYTNEETKQQYAYLLPKEKRYLRKASKIERKLCMLPIKEVFIWLNGILSICCVDIDDASGMPIIKENGFMSNWKSKNVLVARKKGFLKQIFLCENCALGDADYGGFSVDLRKS